MVSKDSMHESKYILPAWVKIICPKECPLSTLNCCGMYCLSFPSIELTVPHYTYLHVRLL